MEGELGAVHGDARVTGHPPVSPAHLVPPDDNDHDDDHDEIMIMIMNDTVPVSAHGGGGGGGAVDEDIVLAAVVPCDPGQGGGRPADLETGGHVSLVL